jgi:phage terminase large subunit-like protein
MNAMTDTRDRWSTAVPDWAERITSGRSIIPALPLDDSRADRALRLFKQMRVHDIPGTPTYGEVCADFIFDLVRAIFGAFDEETNKRMIREYFVMIPKKNGKTSIAAAIMLTALLVNERPAAKALMVAPVIKTAMEAYDQARGIIRLTVLDDGTALEPLFHAVDHERKLKYLRDDLPSELLIKAADTDNVTGSKASMVMIDETHVFASKPAASGVFVEIRGGLSHPKNTGFLLQITTQSKSPPSGVFKSELHRARDIRDGKKSGPMLPVLYELPAEMQINGDWKDRRTWGMVNPHLGRSVDETFLEEELAKAEDNGPDHVALTASQHFNVEIGVGHNADSWSGVAHWQAAARPGVTLEHILAGAEVATIGVDWGGADDLAALAVIGRFPDKSWKVWVKAWARPSVFKARPKIADRLRDFERDGDLAVVPTGEAQAAEAAGICQQVFESGLLPETGGIGLDAAGIDLLIDALDTRGLVHPLVVPVSQQGWKLQPAVSGIPLRLEAGTLVHGGQGLLTWCVGNAKQRLKSSSYVVEKELAGAAKIDALFAMFNAAIRMRENPEASGGPSVYEGRGLLVV